MQRLWSSFVVVLLLLAGCDKQAWFDKFVPTEEVEYSKRFIASLSSRDFTAAEGQLDPSLLGPSARSQLQQVAELFPQGAPREIQVVGANTMRSPQGQDFDLTFQYSYPDKWLLANVVLQKRGGTLKVAGVHVNPLRDSLQNTNGFTFAGKSLVHYIFLVLAVAIPLFVVFALVACARTAVPKRKWLWFLFITLGFVQLSLNWSDGAVNVKPLAFLLFGAGYFQAGPAAPYILSIAFPLGAILFFVKRRAWQAQRAG
jgi:hypothetical protein